MRVLRVNMIPFSASGETYQDSEPFLAVNPANPDLIVGTAFTPDPAGGPNAPIFVSRDRGRTWSLWSFIPGATSDLPTADITVAFDGTGNNLYIAVILANSVMSRRFATTVVMRTSDVSTMTPPTTVFSQPASTPLVVDQPVVSATTATSGADHVYVGCNDYNSYPGATGKVLLSSDAASSSPGFNLVALDSRPTLLDAKVRSAPHPDGTIYVAFLACRSQPMPGVYMADVVVTRDDNRGSGTAATGAFTALRDSTDGEAGQRVIQNVTIAAEEMGQERVGLALVIAVDPRNSRTVYLAWVDKQGSSQTLHLRRSDDGGQTWGSGDLLTVSNATNPGLAVNSLGEVALMYQQLTDVGAEQRWETHVRLLLGRRIWDGLAFVNNRDLVLASAPATVPRAHHLPFLGDYLGLVSVGRDFYGVFSACNIPDLVNFPPYNEHTDAAPGGPHYVIYQRNADFTRHTLLNVEGRDVVAPSIDPFFVSISFDDEFRRIGVGAILVEHSGCGESPLADASATFSIRTEVHQPWWRESELVSVTYNWTNSDGTQESATNTNSGFQVRMPPVRSDGTVAPVEVSVRIEIRVGDSAPRSFERRVTVRPITPDQDQLACLMYKVQAFIYQFLLTVLPPFRHVGPFPDPPPYLQQTLPGNFTWTVLRAYQRIVRVLRFQ